MKTAEAIEICERWFAHLERQKARSVQLQKLASLARQGPEQAKEARRRLRQLDTSSVTVFDGGYLRPAVQHLVKLAKESR